MMHLLRILIHHIEFVMIVLFLLAAYEQPITFNPLYVILALVFLIQYITHNRYVGLILGSGILILATFFFLAFLSEFHEFPSINNESLKFLIGGMLIWLIIVFVGVAMIYKYYKIKKTPAY
ncbi:MAG: hypothetical protein JNM95_05055 [Chitinophagaceae bacterium]|nr:hypothetical protein [Chitinophagaceae bacterium]